MSIPSSSESGVSRLTAGGAPPDSLMSDGTVSYAWRACGHVDGGVLLPVQERPLRRRLTGRLPEPVPGGLERRGEGWHPISDLLVGPGTGPPARLAEDIWRFIAERTVHRLLGDGAAGLGEEKRDQASVCVQRRVVLVWV